MQLIRFNIKNSAQYLERNSSRSYPAAFRCHSGAISVYPVGKEPLENVKVESVQGESHVYLTNGDLLVSNEKMTDRELFLLSSRYENSARWLELLTFKKILFLIFALVLALSVYRYAFLILSSILVFFFPIELEKKLGDFAYKALKEEILDDTSLSSDQKNRVLQSYDILLKSSSLSYKPVLAFHKSEILGANALAFPGGPIVVTDDLVYLLGDKDLLAPVLAHELVHIEEQHSIKQLIRILGLSTFGLLIFGSQEAIIEEFVLLSINLYALKNSRHFEKQADLGALRLLELSGLQKSSLRKALKKLSYHYCKKEKEDLGSCIEEQGIGWLSTHPSSKTRLDYLEDLIQTDDSNTGSK